ncbi:MAG: SPASM domain-containing protein, partial [Syntrophothermus sp.]
KIILQFLVFRTNQDQISEIRRLGKEWGVNEVKIKTAQFYNFENGNDLIPDLPGYARYDKVQGPDGTSRYKIRNHLPNHCWRMWSSAVFTWEGDVVPCCYDKDAGFKMGNINHESFTQIWRNEKYHRFRQQILKGRKEIGICRNCDQKI